MTCNNAGHHADQIFIYKWHYSLHSAHKGKEAKKRLESVQKEKKKSKRFADAAPKCLERNL